MNDYKFRNWVIDSINNLLDSIEKLPNKLGIYSYFK